MCYPVTCSSCGKVGWGGCGAHVDQVMRNVPQDQRCTCHDKKKAESADKSSSILDWVRGSR